MHTVARSRGSYARGQAVTSAAISDYFDVVARDYLIRSSGRNPLAR